jgi:hypothetical protein
LIGTIAYTGLLFLPWLSIRVERQVMCQVGYPAHLTPYYILGVFILLAQASLGLRIILMSHGVVERGVNHIFFRSRA